MLVWSFEFRSLEFDCYWGFVIWDFHYLNYFVNRCRHLYGQRTRSMKMFHIILLTSLNFKEIRITPFRANEQIPLDVITLQPFSNIRTSAVSLKGGQGLGFRFIVSLRNHENHLFTAEPLRSQRG